MDFLECESEEKELLASAQGFECTCGGSCATLISASEKGCMHCCAQYIGEVGKYVNGGTALMVAAKQGSVGILKLLLPHEAGRKNDDDKTALILAAEAYKFECLIALLKNKGEREASGITPTMLSAYKGDIGDLLARQNEWRAGASGNTMLQSALFRGQRRAIRLLVRANSLREFFTQQIVSRANKDRYSTYRFNPCHTLLVRDFLTVVCGATAKDRAELFSANLVSQTSVARHLRPFCTPINRTAMLHFCGCNDAASLTSALAGLKNHCFPDNEDSLLNIVVKRRRIISQYLDENPLRLKQARLALKFSATYSNARWVAWKEVEAEACFNRLLLLEARSVVWNTAHASHLIRAYNVSSIRQKQALNRHLLLTFVRSMQRIVQEMLDE